MPADNELGDLIVEMRLDDEKYRQAVKQTITATVTEAKAASIKTNAALKHGFNAAEATHSLRALQGTLFLVTGETGFFAVEALRAAFHVATLTSATGGLASALAVAGTAAKSFLVEIGPIGWTLLGVAAAYEIYNKATEGSAEATKKATDAMADYRKELAAAHLERAELEGTITETGAERMRIGAQHPDLTEGQIDVLATTKVANQQKKELLEINKRYEDEYTKIVAEHEARRRDAERQNMEDRAKFEDRVLDEITARNEKERDEIKRTTQAYKDAAKSRKESAEFALLAFRVSHGLGMASEGIADPVQKMIAQLEEQKAAEMKAASNQSSPSFGFGSVDSSSFRFGEGAFGSVIGTQTETAKTNDILKGISDKFDRLAADVAKAAAEIIRTDPMGGYGPHALPGF